MQAQKPKILLAKPGLDGHDRGVKVIARALVENGMEVVYLGLQQTPISIVRAAVEEDVDVVGLSILSGSHMTQFRRVRELMMEHGLEDRLLTGGGIIPDKDRERLAELGIGQLFGPGDDVMEIVDYVRNWVETHPRSTV
jgi:methylmalonyl-CoA mutase C-terminal domain/subunit